MVLPCVVSLVFITVISPLYGLTGSLFTVFALGFILGASLRGGLAELPKDTGYDRLPPLAHGEAVQ